MYRPEGMQENPFSKDNLTGRTCYDIYEAGADAMLEGLKKMGAYSNGDTPVIGFGKGWSVFIPEE